MGDARSVYRPLLFNHRAKAGIGAHTGIGRIRMVDAWDAHGRSINHRLVIDGGSFRGLLLVRLELLSRTNVKNEAHEHPIRLRRATVKAGHGCHRPGLRPDQITRRTLQPDGSYAVEYDLFPSIALGVDRRRFEVESKTSANVKMVSYKGESYVVGPDIVQRIASQGDFGRDLSDDYYNSPIYHALMRGALSFMQEDHIDVLVLGLPVSHFQDPAKPAALKQAYTGKIDLDGTHSVQIDRVVVRPQPLGGFYGVDRHIDAINDVIRAHPQSGLVPLKSWDDLLELTVLCVDPGEFTLDWLLVNHGAANADVSGAAGDAGRHRILNTAKEHLEVTLKRRIAPANLQRLNDSLRTGSAFKLDGKVVDLAEDGLKRAIVRAVDSPVAILMSGLKGSKDVIDLVLMVGGHPALYADAIRKHMPDMPIFTPPHSVFSNVEGLQLIAEQIAALETVPA